MKSTEKFGILLTNDNVRLLEKVENKNSTPSDTAPSIFQVDGGPALQETYELYRLEGHLGQIAVVPRTAVETVKIHSTGQEVKFVNKKRIAFYLTREM